jgi:putative zinc finger/helix-turn-helix YgiT family protein
MRRCVFCKSDRLVSTVADETVEVVGRFFTATVPVTRCEGCGETYVSGPVLERLELTVAQSLAELGIATPEAFRFARKALGLRLADLAELLDVRLETVSRWETGKVPVDRCAFATLAAMVTDELEGRAERTANRLRAARAPKPATPSPLRLTLDAPAAHR